MHRSFKKFVDRFKTLGLTEQFEQIIALILQCLIAVIVLVALWGVIRVSFETLIVDSTVALDHKTFQTLFGMILTLFIALEFMHITKGLLNQLGHLVHVRIVLLISLLAVARKFVVIDKQTTAWELIALAVSALALGGVYWILRCSKEEPRTREVENQAKDP